MDFLEILMKTIIGNKDMPKVQVERELSPIIEIFIEAIMNTLARTKEKMDSGVYQLIGSEFPLQTIGEEKATKRSFNIDYLMLNKTTNTLYLVELKTDSSSFKLEQYRRYNEIIENKTAFKLYEFLTKLTNPKYKRYEKSVNENIDPKEWENIKNIKLIYLAPQKMMNEHKNWGFDRRTLVEEMKKKHIVLSFGDLPERLETHDYRREWGKIRKCLLSLDKN